MKTTKKITFQLAPYKSTPFESKQDRRCDLCYIVASSLNYCCHRNATIPSVFIVVGVYIAVRDMEVFSIATEMEKLVPFALFSNYRLFRTALNNNNNNNNK